MGYRIVYGAEPAHQQKQNGSVRLRILVALSFLAFAGLVRFLYPDGRELLAGYLLPGDLTLTQSAFSGLLDNLRHGLGMVDSLTVFCREILHEII